jgi:maleamate amidohydrolase
MSDAAALDGAADTVPGSTVPAITVPASTVRRLAQDLVGPEEQGVLDRLGAGRHIGFGAVPAIVVIDAQNYMVGAPEGSPVVYPSGCGQMAVDALAVLRTVLAQARSSGILVVYTQYQVRRDGADMGVYRRKRGLPDTEGWCLEGSVGAQIADAIAPEPGDIVLVKKRPSAFWGTPLLGLFVERGVDTVIVAGGSTSNCVRATVVDAMSYGYRTTVLEDCTFDRLSICHRVALFDLERQYADVLASPAVLSYLRTVGKAAVVGEHGASGPEAARA